MSVEIRERNIILTDFRDRPIFIRYMSENRKQIITPVKSMWKESRDVVDLKMAEKIIQFGGVPQELSDIWEAKITDFVRGDLTDEWMKGITAAGNMIAKRVNKIQRKDFAFNDTMETVKVWTDTQGGKLIVDLSAAQYGSAHALIQQQITWGVTSPYLMAQRLKPIVGLTIREGMALSKVMAVLIGEGLPASVVNLQVDKYAKILHNNRAMRIARTEISSSYGFGQWDSVKQARDGGWLPGEPEKDWIAGGINPCAICEENEGEGPIPIDHEFASGHDHNPAHPQCECSVGYSIRR